MAQDIVIGIKTQFEGDMGKTLDTLNTKVKDVTKSVDKLGDAEEKTGKQSKDAGKSFASSVKEIAAGIGVAKLAEGAFGLLKDAFMSNQVVADALKGVMEGVNIIFQEVVGVIIDAVKQTYEASNGFEGLFAVLKGGITIALTPLKAAFYGIKLAIAEVQLLWEQSTFGSGDDKRIKELTADIDAASTSLKEVGTDAIAAGTDIVNNIGKAVNEVSSVVGKSVEGIKKISIEGALAQGKALVQLENNAKKSEAQTQRLNAKYETQAEKLRQIRDDDTKSIAERTAANVKLEAVLNEQEQTLLKNVDIQVAAAQARKNANNTIENQVALTNALAQKDQVLADIEGKRSEQKANEVALRKEGIELTNAEKSTETELALKRRENSTNRIKDDVERLTQQKADLEETKRIELERLQSVIDSTTAGTLAREAAEKEFALKKEELDNALLVKQDEIDAKIVEKAKEVTEKKKKEEEKRRDNAFAIAQEVLGGFSSFVSAIGALDAEQTQNKLNGVIKGSEAEKKILEESFKRQKNLAIVTTLINGAQAIVAALATPDPTLGVLTGIRIGFATLTTGIQIAAIQAKQFSGGGGSAGGGGGTPPANPPPIQSSGIQAPSTIGLGQTNIMPQSTQQPWQKVYVTEGDIRSTINRVEVIETRSKLGG
jgi:hypothetical protein